MPVTLAATYEQACHNEKVPVNSSLIRCFADAAEAGAAPLQVLSLGANLLGPRGLAALLPVLVQCRHTLETIDLRYNRLGTAAVQQLTKCFADVGFSALRRLELRGNPFTYQGGKCLVHWSAGLRPMKAAFTVEGKSTGTGGVGGGTSGGSATQTPPVTAIWFDDVTVQVEYIGIEDTLMSVGLQRALQARISEAIARREVRRQAPPLSPPRLSDVGAPIPPSTSASGGPAMAEAVPSQIPPPSSLPTELAEAGASPGEGSTTFTEVALPGTSVIGHFGVAGSMYESSFFISDAVENGNDESLGMQTGDPVMAAPNFLSFSDHTATTALGETREPTERYSTAAPQGSPATDALQTVDGGGAMEVPPYAAAHAESVPFLDSIRNKRSNTVAPGDETMGGPEATSVVDRFASPASRSILASSEPLSEGTQDDAQCWSSASSQQQWQRECTEPPSTRPPYSSLPTTTITNFLDGLGLETAEGVEDQSDNFALDVIDSPEDVPAFLL